MAESIAALTEKLYTEGVQKGEVKAAQITAAAHAAAQKIIADAEAHAAQVKAHAIRESDNLRRTVETDIKLAGIQAAETIRQQIIDAVVARASDERIASLLANPTSLKELIISFIQAWKATGQAGDLELMLPESTRAVLESSLAAEASQILGQGVNLSFIKGLKGGFQVGKKDGGFKITLTDNDFKEFFRAFLSPRTRTLLFGK